MQAVAEPLTNVENQNAYDLLKAAANGRVGVDQALLHRLLDDPAKTLPDIVRFASEDHEEDRLALDDDLVAIFNYLKSPEALPFLLSDIRQDPKEIRDDTVEALVRIGQPAIDPLLNLYHEIGDDEGEEVAFLLAGMAIRDQRIRDLLMKRVEMGFDDALFHLEVYHDPEVIPELKKRLESMEDGEAKMDLADTIEDLEEERPPSEIADFDIFAQYPAKQLPEFEILDEEERFEFLNSPDPELRAGAAQSFFGEEFSDKIRAKLLDLAHSDPVDEVRASSWEAMFDLTVEPELRKSMMDRLQNPATPKIERAGLAIGLCRHSDQPPVREAIVQLALDPETRERAVEAMWRSFDPSFGPLIPPFLGDGDVEVQRNAMWGIGYLQLHADAELLRDFFDHEELRPDALHNYALAVPGPTTAKRMRNLLKDIEKLAQGLSEGEETIVQAALDVRLVQAGLKPIFEPMGDDEEPIVQAVASKVGRNDPCPCGSGKKYKKCHGE